MKSESFNWKTRLETYLYLREVALQKKYSPLAFRYKAFLEEIDYSINRGLDRNQIERLASLDFIRQGQNIFITGSSGTGKSYMATALGYGCCCRSWQQGKYPRI